MKGPVIKIDTLIFINCLIGLLRLNSWNITLCRYMISLFVMKKINLKSEIVVNILCSVYRYILLLEILEITKSIGSYAHFNKKFNVWEFSNMTYIKAPILDYL